MKNIEFIEFLCNKTYGFIIAVLFSIGVTWRMVYKIKSIM